MSKLGQFRHGGRAWGDANATPMGDPWFAAALGAVTSLWGLFKKKAPKAIAAIGAKIPAAARAVGRALPGAAAAAGAGAAGGAATALLGGGGSTGMRRRGKGISATELRGFKRVTSLLRKVGMKPKGLAGSSRRRCK